MMINFCESGHPVFRARNALARREAEKQGSGKLSTCFFGETVDVFFRIVLSLNQLNI